MSSNSKHIEEILSQTKRPDAEKLLDYVDGNLSREQNREVELAMADDLMVNETVEGIQLIGTDAFRELMNDMDASLQERINKRPAAKQIQFVPRKNTFIGIAASIVVLAIVGYFAIFAGGASDPAAIALDHYKARTAITVMGEDANASDEYERASSYYEKGNFSEAAGIFQELPGSAAKLMAGHAFFQLKQYDKAATQFEAAVKIDEGNRADAEYNLALCYLTLKKTDQAKDILQKIAADDYHNFHQQANNVLKDL